MCASRSPALQCNGQPHTKCHLIRANRMSKKKKLFTFFSNRIVTCLVRVYWVIDSGSAQISWVFYMLWVHICRRPFETQVDRTFSFVSREESKKKVYHTNKRIPFFNLVVGRCNDYNNLPEWFGAVQACSDFVCLITNKNSKQSERKRKKIRERDTDK